MNVTFFITHVCILRNVNYVNVYVKFILHDKTFITLVHMKYN